MSAGNTVEEAFVQGVAEIMERYVQKKILLESPTLPDIPIEYLAQFPQILGFFTKANETPGYKCILKDCSFGGKYPVAALLVLEENTGRYGVKLGCHPDFGIAMERTFTEAAQGQDIITYSDRSVFDFYNDRVKDNMNIYNTYKVGKGQFPHQFIGGEPDYPFTEMSSVKDLTNKEMAKNWCESILADGYDVLIRDVSNLGFPSLHIIVPGMSEMFEADDMRYKIYNTRNFVMTLLTNPANVTKDNCKYVITIMEYFLGSILENDISSYFQWYKGELPCSKTGLGCLYMVAMCHYLAGDFDKAAAKINMILTLIDNGKINNKGELSNSDYHWYKGVYYLASAMDTLKSYDKATEYLNLLFDEAIMEKLHNVFSVQSEVIVKQYPDYAIYVESGVDPYLDEYSKIRCKLQEFQIQNPISQTINRRIFE